MTKHDAVDRLMALATEKRADRVPPVPASAATGTEAGALSDSEQSAQPADSAQEPASHPAVPSPTPVVEPPPSRQAKSTSTLLVPQVNRGRQFLSTIRPLLPAIAGAMRLVDHGAVQAAARLLPLLGGPSGPNPQATAATAAQEQFARGALELEAAHAEIRKHLNALQLQAVTAEEQLGRARTQLERLTSEHLTTRSETQKLSQRVRLLTAASIILLMLVIAQMILLAVTFHS